MHDYLCNDSMYCADKVSEHTRVDTCLVLQYHRVASLCHDSLQLAVEPYHFEEQMEYLAENFNVISLDEMKFHLDTSTPFKQRTVVITFDGGYSDLLYTAKDVLKTYAVPAAVFMTSASIVEGGRFWWQKLEDFIVANQCDGELELEIDYQLRKWSLSTQLDRYKAYDDLYSILSNKTPLQQRRIIEHLAERLELNAEELDYHRTMSVRELKQLAEDELITIGGHTHSCANLLTLSKSHQIVEISRNKEILEELLNRKIKYFSYPFGSEVGYTPQIAGILQNVGYSLACGNSYGKVDITLDTSRYDLPRVKVGNLNKFAFHRFLLRFFD